jgi:hypothetical protein
MSHLLLVAFVARALVPAGYMPDFSARSDAGLKIIICTAAGAKTLLLDESGTPSPSPDSNYPDQPCAFAGLAAVALPALLPLTNAIEFEPVAFAPHAIADRPPARAGPALGSRGPPLIS